MRQRSIRVVAVAVLAIVTSVGCRPVASGGAGVLWTFRGGTQPEVFTEGVHIVMPWNQLIVYDIRLQDRTEVVQGLTNNGLSVGLEVSCRFQPIAVELPKLHSGIGPAYYDKIVKPIIRSVVREVVGNYTPEDIYSKKRNEIGQEIFARAKTEIEGKHLRVETILLRNVELPDKLKSAIEEKLEEEQRAEKMQFVLLREKQEAERKRIEAQGIADFQTIVAKGISAELLRWKGIEATEQLASSDNAKVVVIGSGADGLPLILGGAGP